MLPDTGIHFDLYPFDVRTMFGVDAGNFGTQKNSAIAIRFGLEFQTQIEISVTLLGRKISVLVYRALAENCPVLDDPFFLTIVLPAGQIFALKKRRPAGSRNTPQGKSADADE